jgi:hypothetical protein
MNEEKVLLYLIGILLALLLLWLICDWIAWK